VASSLNVLHWSDALTVRKRTRILIGLLATALLVLVLGALFVVYQVRKSFPQTDGSVTVAGLSDQVDVYRDEFGVPHLVARSERDLMIAMGYVHAQDRLWQMDLARRAAQGRLAELFGREAVDFDRMFRIVGLERASARVLEALPERSRERLDWYAAGVNAAQASMKGRLPVEFDLLSYEPEPWRAEHSIELSRLLAWELNLSWWTDVTFGAIAERVGIPHALEIMPPYPESVEPAVSRALWRRNLARGLAYARTARAYGEAFGRASGAGGSNAWAIAPSRTTSGGALLANDTHLILALPSQWYELQLRLPGGMVRGMSVPGIPGVVAGRNDSIAWGITNLMADEADFFVEQLDTSGTRVLDGGLWRDLELESQEIQVRGDSALQITVRRSPRGPLISDLGPLLKRYSPSEAMSMRWTGYEADDPFEAFHLINTAHDWESFSRGVCAFTVPAQNFVYADVRGMIGFRAGGRIPLRARRSALLPLPGWDRGSDWRGYVPSAELPWMVNPPEGFIASANDKLVDDSYPYYISDLWEPPSRIQRLREILGDRSRMFSVADCGRLQQDSYSHFGCELRDHLLQAVEDSALGITEEETVLQVLRNWNCTFATDELASTIVNQTLVRLLENVFLDEMGPDLYHDFVMLANVPVRVIARLLAEGHSVWFDDIRTPQEESKGEIIRRSLREAAEALRSRLGEQVRLWRWGELHTVTFRHPLGLVRPLDAVFNRGPYACAGGTTALISGEYRFTDPFAVVVGPAYRQIFDLSSTTEFRVVLPPGQSGQAYHAHYDDQLRLWRMGGYRTGRFLEDREHWECLHLEPKR
jgi:penicillin amidase